MLQLVVGLVLIFKFLAPVLEVEPSAEMLASSANRDDAAWLVCTHGLNLVKHSIVLVDTFASELEVFVGEDYVVHGSCVNIGDFFVARECNQF